MANLKRTGTRAALLAAGILIAVGAGQSSSDWVEQEARLGGAFGAFLAGRSAVQSHDLPTAATNLERALRDDPGVPELQSQAFLAALVAGQSQTAARLAASLPDNPLAQLVLADRDGRAGHWESAEARFTALTQQQALTQVLRPLLIAWAQQGQGHTEAALGTLAPLLEGTRFRGVYALHAAMIADLGGKAAAGRFYRVAAADYGPLNLRLGVILASWQARQGQLEEAQRTISDLAAANGDLAIARQGLEAGVAATAVRGAADGIAEAYLAMAATLHQQGSDSAPFLLQLALEMRPGFTAARILLADIQEGAKRPEEALATLAEVPKDDPLAPVVSLRRASLLDQAGQTDAADKLLDQLAREHPARPEPLAQKGDMLRRKSRFAEAAKAYTAAIDRIGTPNRASWPLFYERGIALERSGQWPEAESDLKYALQLAPNQPSVLNYLAYSWADRGEHLDEARSMLERALTALPNDGAIIDSVGWVLLRQGDTAGAIKQLDRAVELQPEDPVINGHLGDALAAAGRTREAEFQWRRALNLKPDEEDAKKLNEKLASLRGPANPATAAVPGATVPR
jgi:tetratricopeptide (TPR) repeat protein